MKRFAITGAAVAVAVAVAGVALAAIPNAGAITAATACTPKQTTNGELPVIKYCGPAVATVRAAGKTFRISGGTCVTQPRTFFAHIGTNAPRLSGLQKLPFFSLIVDARHPSQGAIIGWIVDGKRYRAAVGARVAINGRKVTFSGRLAPEPGSTGSGAFSGTLNCGS